MEYGNGTRNFRTQLKSAVQRDLSQWALFRIKNDCLSSAKSVGSFCSKGAVAVPPSHRRTSLGKEAVAIYRSGAIFGRI